MDETLFRDFPVIMFPNRRRQKSKLAISFLTMCTCLLMRLIHVPSLNSCTNNVRRIHCHWWHILNLSTRILKQKKVLLFSAQTRRNNKPFHWYSGTIKLFVYCNTDKILRIREVFSHTVSINTWSLEHLLVVKSNQSELSCNDRPIPVSEFRKKKREKSRQ